MEEGVPKMETSHFTRARATHFAGNWKRGQTQESLGNKTCCHGDATDYNRAHFEEAAINGAVLFMILIKSVETKRALECQNGSRLFLLKTKRLKQLLKKFAPRKWDE